MEKTDKESLFFSVAIWYVLIMGVLVVLTFAAQDEKAKQNPMAKYETQSVDAEIKESESKLPAAVCSARCLQSPINLTEHLEYFFKTKKVHVFYEPYFRDLKFYNYDKIEHKECCLRVEV